MASSRSDPALGFDALRDDLAELATVVLAQVERAVAGWEESDPSVAEVVADTDREVDVRSAALEERILELHRNWSAFAGDLRLLHVGLIAAVALERVGNLAVQIARLAGSVPPPEAEMSTGPRPGGADGRAGRRRPRPSRCRPSPAATWPPASGRCARRAR